MGKEKKHKMKIIVTAGGTAEAIDRVRAISNHATGRLGSMIADEFLSKMSGNDRLYYLCSEHSAIPSKSSENLEIIKIQGTDDLLNQACALLKNSKIDAFIHSMAMSDFKVKKTASLDAVAETLFQQKNLVAGADSPKKLQEIVQKAIEKMRCIAAANFHQPLKIRFCFLKKRPK